MGICRRFQQTGNTADRLGEQLTGAIEDLISIQLLIPCLTSS